MIEEAQMSINVSENYNGIMESIYMNNELKGIEAYGLDGISDLLISMGYPKFRAKQLMQWIYSHDVTSYDQMTNLPIKLRNELHEKAPLNIPIITDKQVSKDESRKYVLSLSDGNKIETVGIPSHETDINGNPKRLTVCFSTQVGCPMECAFCATGQEGLTRNLYPGEMVQQILTVQRDFGIKVTNVVAMGQGEPFLNYQNLIDALRIINSKDGLNIGARHITVSTCGIINGIKDFGLEKEQFTLAVSLHSAQQEIRNAIMPKCKNMTLAELKGALRDYYHNSSRRISFEYLMIADVNDTDKDLEALINYCNDIHAHINLIPLNDIDDSPWKPSKKNTVRKWIDKLNDSGIEATLRNSRGSDINGACGQLKNKKISQ